MTSRQGRWLLLTWKRGRSHLGRIYSLEGDLDPGTILFYDKLLQALSQVADEAENTGDLLRTMIVKG